MDGTIRFETLEQLADFLTHFAGCTATFTVRPEAQWWVLTFNGGY